MKRDGRPRIKVRLVFPLFHWVKCDKCGYEFKWQYMWKASIPQGKVYRRNHVSTLYYCPKCAVLANNVIEEIYIKFVKSGYINQVDDVLFNSISDVTKRRGIKLYSKPSAPPAPAKKKVADN